MASNRSLSNTGWIASCMMRYFEDGMPGQPLTTRSELRLPA